LVTHGHLVTAPLTRANNFVFRNLTRPGDYNLDIYCRDFDFEPGVVVVPQKEGDAVEVYRRNRKTSARGARIFPGDGGAVEVKLGRRREYYEKRGGCMVFPRLGYSSLWEIKGGADVRGPVELVSMLKSPMILMALAGLVLVFGMPYLLENSASPLATSLQSSGLPRPFPSTSGNAITDTTGALQWTPK
ncbi:MAG: hypothetical protein Q9207_008507, partial [Kuettlingeria erythrocarpa]